MMIKQELEQAAKKFKICKIKFPHLEAEILLSQIIKKPREYLFAHPETELSQLQISNYKLLIKRRIHGEPIAYIIGEKEFYGLKFLINKNVLIPRPETELLVDAALAIAQENNQPATFIDIGTGSGCIITSIAKTVIFNFQFSIFKQFSISNFQFFGTDISKKALLIAKKNAKLNDLEKKIKFLNGDLLEPFTPTLKIENLKLKIICANLPYLTPTQFKNSPSIRREPRLALTAGSDGLKYYRQLFRQISQLKLQNYILLCEIDPSQKAAIKRLAKQLLPPHDLTLKEDLRGHSRLAVISSQ